VFKKIMESNLSNTALATTATPLDRLVRAEVDAPTAAAVSTEPKITGFMVDLWVRLGIVGIIVVGASLAASLFGGASIVDAAFGVVAGGVLAVIAWRQTRSAFRAASDVSA
jgi:hypothetical protein